ncbi:hypothetical protein ABZ897_15950 [Nonomuraea sp. NPDC046802]|uniref:hypothetical protein n=1 Tax=Nonomuraea sp. NPDC046802 TaxID=3154919 RepID=UPI0033E6240E
MSDHQDGSTIHQRIVQRIEGERRYSVVVSVRRFDWGTPGGPEIVVLPLGPDMDHEARLNRESALAMADACEVLTVDSPEPTMILAKALRAAVALMDDDGGEQVNETIPSRAEPIDLDAVVERRRGRAGWDGVLEPAAVARAKVAAELVEAWNARYQVGQPVRYWTGFRDGPLADEPKFSRTRTLAQLLGGHTAVVWMDGEGSCVGLSHVDPITEHELEEQGQ